MRCSPRNDCRPAAAIDQGFEQDRGAADSLRFPGNRLAGPLPIGATLSGAGGFDGYRIVIRPIPIPASQTWRCAGRFWNYGGFFWGRLTSTRRQAFMRQRLLDAAAAALRSEDVLLVLGSRGAALAYERGLKAPGRARWRPGFGAEIRAPGMVASALCPSCVLAGNLTARRCQRINNYRIVNGAPKNSTASANAPRPLSAMPLSLCRCHLQT
jgi:hypothetical protein